MEAPDAEINTRGLQGFGSMQITPTGSSTSSPAKSSNPTESSQIDEGSASFDKAHENAKRAYETLVRYTFEHGEMSPRMWCVNISGNQEFFGSLAKFRFARILKYDTPSGPLFTVAEHTEQITSHSIQHFTGEHDLFVGRISPEISTVTLEQLLKPRIPHVSWPRLVISSELFVNDESFLAIQYSATRTLKLTKKTFEAITRYFPSHTGSLGTINLRAPSIWDGLSNLEEWKGEVMRRISTLEDTDICLSDSLKLHRRTNRAKLENVDRIIEKHTHDMDDMRQKFGPRHETVTEVSLAATRGGDWGKGKTISGLNDIFSYVAEGLNTTVSNRYNAGRKLYKYLVRGFKGWDYNPEGAELSKISIDKLYPYAKLQYWLDVAEKTPDYKNSEYYKHVGKYLKMGLHRHKDIVGGIPIKDKKILLLDALFGHDHHVALAIFWLIIDPVKYQPRLGENFTSWNSMPTTLEWDHRGSFVKVLDTFWKYEGAESKSSYSEVDSAREQLERRFQLIDAVARLAFNATFIFSGNVYVGYIPAGAKTLFETSGKAGLAAIPISHEPTSGDDSDSSYEGGAMSKELPEGLKGYTVVQVLTSGMEFDRKNQ